MREIKVSMYLIRHGKVKGNLEKRFVGTTDEELTAEGAGYIKECHDSGRYSSVDYLYVSPMKRCRQTAQIIYPDIDQLVIDGFREMDFGEFEEKNYEELNGNKAYQDWIDSNGELPFPGGEGREEFSKRVMEGFDKLVDDLRRRLEDTAIALVVHGGTIMALQSALGLCGFFDRMPDNGDVIKVDLIVDEEGYRVVND